MRKLWVIEFGGEHRDQIGAGRETAINAKRLPGAVVFGLSEHRIIIPAECRHVGFAQTIPSDVHHEKAEKPGNRDVCLRLGP